MVRQDKYNVPQAGMDTDTHPMELKDASYTFAKNAILNSEGGDGMVKLQNEPSNLLNSVLPVGFVVIGNIYDALTNRVYLFLANDTTKVSEIGFITLGSELDLKDNDWSYACDHKEIITEKLEEIAQLPSNVYTTLLSDDCNGTLNFSITHPFREGTIDLKNEKCGKVLYFTDNLNPTRRLELDNIDWYKQSDEESEGVRTNLDYNIISPIPDWVHQVKTATGYSYTVDNNTEVAGRNTTLLLQQDESGRQVAITIRQDGIFIPPTPVDWKYTFELVPETIAASGLGGVFPVSLDSFRDNQLTPFQHEELSVSLEGLPNWIQYDSETKEFVISENLGTIPRETSLLLRQAESNSILRLTIIQEVAPPAPDPDPEWRYILNVAPVSQQCSSASHIIPYSILSYKQDIHHPDILNNIDYTITSDSPWLVVDTFFGQLNIAANTTSAVREGIVTVTQNESGYTETITIKQGVTINIYPDPPAPQLPIDFLFTESSLTNTEFFFIGTDISARNTDVSSYRYLFSNPDNHIPIDFRLRALDSWVTIENTSDNTYSITPSTNSGDDRETYVVFEQRINGVVIEVGRYKVFQQGIPFTYTFRLLPTVMVFSNTEGQQTINPRTSNKSNSSTPIPVGYAIESGYPSWVTPALDRISVENNLGGYRTTSVTYTQEESGKQIVIEVRQQAQPVVTFSSAYSSEIEISAISDAQVSESPSDLLRDSILQANSSLTTSFILFANPSNLSFTADDTSSKHIFVTSYREDFDPSSTPLTCVNVERLRLRPRYSKPCITPIAISNGGNLKMGVYEYVVAACDKQGNEFTPFYAATTPVSIFNKADVIMGQPEMAGNSNMGVLLQVEWDDPRVKYYKIVVAQTASLDSTTTYYEEGIYPIYTRTITHTDDFSKQPTTLQHLYQMPMVYEKTRMLTSSNGYLFEGGITVKKALNLQPAALLIGALALWQTVETLEGLYSNGTSSALYKSALRDEVYPYGIRFTGKSGYVSDTFVMASRPSRPFDVEVLLSTNMNVESIRNGAQACTMETRLFRYQFENTATLLDYKIEDESLVDVGGGAINLSTNCNVKPYETGEFAYWESETTYPDNDELFNAQNLHIEESDLPDIPYVKDTFEEFFVESKTGGQYTLNSNADFRNKGIRHFKYPDFNVSPFMDCTEEATSDPKAQFTDSNIYPIGFYIHEDVVKFALDISLKNGLLTQEEYNDIDGFEILRGDRTIHKSIIAKGLGYDMYSYNDTTSQPEQEIWYPNFPYNDLTSNKLQYIRRGSDRDSGTIIPHPYEGKKNNKFAFHSPDISFHKPQLPQELVLEGYQYGWSKGVFNQVRDHSRWVILTSNAFNIARTLAMAEVLLDVLGKYGDNIMAQATIKDRDITGTVDYTSGLGLTSTKVVTVTSVPPAVATDTTTSAPFKVDYDLTLSTDTGWQEKIVMGLSAATILGSIGASYAEAYTRWLEIFKKFGEPINFAYYYTSVGHYNKGVKNLDNNNNTTESNLRTLMAAHYISNAGMVSVSEQTGINTREQVKLNARDRESFVYLSTGEHYPLDVNSNVRKEFDESRVIAGDDGYTGNNDREVFADIASPYFSLKQYLPNQYASVNSIKWLPTGHCGIFGRKKHHQIFGGDTFITRYALKRKVPFWYSTAHGLRDREQFNYTQYDNIGQNVYYANYDTSDIEELDIQGIPAAIAALIGINAPTPKWRTDAKFDTLHESGNYVRESSKLYLYYYGIPSFLCESSVNCDYRFAKARPEEMFYPQVEDYVEWTQESTVSIREDNKFFYNNVYSKNAMLANGGVLPETYEKEEYDCRFDMPNGVIYSMQDTGEQDMTDPWSVFRPLDFYQFPSSFGRLVRLKGIESSQVLGLFENQVVLYNAIDVLRERTESTTRELGTGGIFAKRPVEFFKSDLGYGGSQHSALLSTPYGHFYIDCQRGFFMLIQPNGKGMQPISKGKSRWFKKHLPFKILKGGIKGLTSLDVDNNYNHLGVTLGWDNKYDRIIFTKVDYIVNKEWRNKLMYEEGRLYKLTEEGFRGEEVVITDSNIFKNASFTMSYSPVQGYWSSYHSYTPNYIISNSETFATGYNIGNKNGIVDSSIWEHNRTEQSFCVFQNKLYSFEIEYPVTNTAANNSLSNVAYWLDCRRYKDATNYAALTRIGFDETFIYNETENTGVMNLVVEEKNNRRQYIEYPKYVGNNLHILVANRDKEWNLNSIYNRIRRENVNVPQLLSDVNEIDFEPNSSVIDRSTRKQDFLRGNWFKMRLRAKKSSYKLISNWFRSSIQS